jgi:hypothetical protein
VADTMETLAGQTALFGWFFGHLWLGVPGQYRDIYRSYNNILAGLDHKSICDSKIFCPIAQEYSFCSSRSSVQFAVSHQVGTEARGECAFPPLTPRISCSKTDALIQRRRLHFHTYGKGDERLHQISCEGGDARNMIFQLGKMNDFCQA